MGSPRSHSALAAVRGLAFLIVSFVAAMACAGAGESINIPATATTPALPGYVARPTGVAKAPAILVLHDCGGFKHRYIEIADDLAKRGYVAVAFDSLAAEGLKNACNRESGSSIQADDAVAVLAWMQAQPYIDAAHLGVLGYSMGAIATLELVDQAHIDAPAGVTAAVAYYPRCRPRAGANVQVPLRILDGSDDDWTPAPACQAFAQAAVTAGKTVVITTYPGVTHGFDQPGDRMSFGHHLQFNGPATADAQKQMLAFFAQYLAASPSPSP